MILNLLLLPSSKCWGKFLSCCVAKPQDSDDGLLARFFTNYLTLFSLGARLGREHRRDGEHSDPPLRGRPPPQVLQRDDGHVLKGQVYRSMGHGVANRD